MKYYYFVSAAVHNNLNDKIAFYNCEYITDQEIHSIDQIYRLAEFIRNSQPVGSFERSQLFISIVNYKLLRQEQE